MHKEPSGDLIDLISYLSGGLQIVKGAKQSLLF